MVCAARLRGLATAGGALGPGSLPSEAPALREPLPLGRTGVGPALRESAPALGQPSAPPRPSLPGPQGSQVWRAGPGVGAPRPRRGLTETRSRRFPQSLGSLAATKGPRGLSGSLVAATRRKASGRWGAL